MTKLDCHAADENERLAAFRNVHDVWGGGRNLEEHLAARLASVQHQRATWFVGTIGGRVVASLGCYPLTFCRHGEDVAGFAIGAVHVLAEFRGHGFAPQLIDHVENHQRADGCRLSLLYSDINPGYYAKLGYRQCPAWEGQARVESLLGDISTRIEQVTYESHAVEIHRRFSSAHEALPLFIQRTPADWDYLHRKSPDDLYFLIDDPRSEARGYVRLRKLEKGLAIHDHAVSPADTETETAWIASVARITHEKGIRNLSGWMPNTPAFASQFTIQPRTEEITMLKDLQGMEITEAEIKAANHFHEIEHV